jgi:hypothetical protein
VADFTAVIPNHAALRENKWLPGDALERPRDDFLRMAQSINGGCIDPIDPRIKCLAKGEDGVAVILAAPAEFPAGATNGPSPQTQARDNQVRIAKLFRVHGIVS